MYFTIRILRRRSSPNQVLARHRPVKFWWKTYHNRACLEKNQLQLYKVNRRRSRACSWAKDSAHHSLKRYRRCRLVHKAWWRPRRRWRPRSSRWRMCRAQHSKGLSRQLATIQRSSSQRSITVLQAAPTPCQLSVAHRMNLNWVWHQRSSCQLCRRYVT